MIAAKDLRIGNWVYGPSDRIEIVTGLNDHSIETKKSGIDFDWELESYFSGIPLTEEWLVKCGFEHYHKAYPHECWKLKNGFCLYKEGKCFLFRECFKTAMGRVSYLHQLQNLYFALTGQELQINSD